MKNIFNPAKAAEEIKNEYIGYISTSFCFREQYIQQRLVDRLQSFVAKGPIVEIKDSFRSGRSIEELIQEGVLSPLFRELEKTKEKPNIPVTRPLYLHQEKAIRKIAAGENIVVSTGTGSGKTNCFVIPILNELLREKEQGTLNSGVRAIFIYPMNALANDQIKGLREILMDYPDIRFGVYNGGTANNESDAIKLYELMASNEKHPKLRKRLPNEELSRDEMKKNPPHILFTNYAMLEHMLLRPKDDSIFANSNFKYIVLDEAHVYTGATGIETAFLMGRLKGRIAGTKAPQFILTSATLGDGSDQSNARVIQFASSLTGSKFKTDNIVTAYREDSYKTTNTRNYPVKLYLDLASETNSLKDVLASYNITMNQDSKETKEVLFDLLSSSSLYNYMRDIGSLVDFETITKKLQISADVAVAFIHLCSKAVKNGKPLIDVRYHYFLKALDGCYMALDHPDSFSMIRKSEYHVHYGNDVCMFEIAVCDDCGEMAIVGKIEKRGHKEVLVQGNKSDIVDCFQVCKEDDKEIDEGKEFILCKTCGAIVSIDEAHNKWCDCGNTQPIRVQRIDKGCSVCKGNIRRVNLGYEAATGVIAASLYEQIPEYKTTSSEQGVGSNQTNMFFQTQKQQVVEEKTGSQFLIFSDSRQGAAKFACYLGDSYKEFLRRRGIWNIASNEGKSYPNGLSVSDFVQLLINYFSSINLFRKNNSDEVEPTPIDDRRNAWVGVLNEMCHSNRATSLVSLGKISFAYKGNTDDIVSVLVNNFKVSKEIAQNFLNYLAFEIVQSGAIETNSTNDIGDSDRAYLFYTSFQKVIKKIKESSDDLATGFLPAMQTLKSGVQKYYKSNKLLITKSALNIDNDADAVKFLDQYWEYLISDSNKYKLESRNGKGYVMPAKHFTVQFGDNAKLWICQKCKKVTQFNIGGKCIRTNCTGELERLDSAEFCRDNHYARLYQSSKVSPLFVKEHTAQLSKKDALDYQQQFIRKEINALSCSTTFEMGVDVGGLETVFLRNIPPLPSNYAQRVGRAGRSVNAAAFALTFARLGSHDFTFFDNPREMINGKIYPPHLILENEKILKRHIYAIAFAMYLKMNPEQYAGNDAKEFINNKGYSGFFDWLLSEPEDLHNMIRESIPSLSMGAKSKGEDLISKYVTSFEWVTEFCGDDGLFSKAIKDFEQNVKYLKTELLKARKSGDGVAILQLENKLKRYEKNDLIDFLVRRNILPKYGFPVDTVELAQNISSKDFRTLNLNRDLSVAIAEYAPSSEVVADGALYTSRYIKKSIVNRSEMKEFETGYFARCEECDNETYSNIPISSDGIECMICGKILKARDFKKSIEPRGGFIAEEDAKPVPLSSQERKYKTEAIYIGDKDCYPINKYNYVFNDIEIEVESTTNDSLVVKSLDDFYVCYNCGYSIAGDEVSKLREYEDYKLGAQKIEKHSTGHRNPFGRGLCKCKTLYKYSLHHEFKTDVAKITFNCNTSDNATMMSVMYALLNAFANQLNIEKRDIKACLTYKKNSNGTEHKIIIYDAVPGGAGHSRQLVTQDGEILRLVIQRAVDLLSSCECSPSCYRCLRSYDNQKVHDIISREKALDFLSQFISK